MGLDRHDARRKTGKTASRRELRDGRDRAKGKSRGSAREYIRVLD